MFLNLLDKKERMDFLELAAIAMQVNGVVEESEENVFNTYKAETGLLDYELKNKEYKSLVQSFQASTKKIKKAIIIELVGVLDADENIDDNEQKWITELGKEWGFRDTEIKRMVRWTQDFNDLLNEGYNYINSR